MCFQKKFWWNVSFPPFYQQQQYQTHEAELRSNNEATCFKDFPLSKQASSRADRFLSWYLASLSQRKGRFSSEDLRNCYNRQIKSEKKFKKILGTYCLLFWYLAISFSRRCPTNCDGSTQSKILVHAGQGLKSRSHQPTFLKYKHK